MLGDFNCFPSIAVSDLEAAKKFYSDTLGLKQLSETPGGVLYQSGEGHVFVYPSMTAGTNQATYAGWTVEDVEKTVSNLKEKGVTFEQYDDLPQVKRDGDIHTMGDLKAAWFKDPTGNILSIANGNG
jgi:catechol 2,3-dioxygenase-like lactoylglutathione lyase family enzyme